MTPPELSRALSALADRVERLKPLSHDPDRYHEEKSEIREALRRLADDLASGRLAIGNPKGRFEEQILRRAGRAIPVERRGHRAAAAAAFAR